jgi:hypothetical protein
LTNEVAKAIDQAIMNKEVKDAVQENINNKTVVTPESKIALYERAANEMKGMVIESSFTIKPFSEGSARSELESDHDKIIQM